MKRVVMDVATVVITVFILVVPKGSVVIGQPGITILQPRIDFSYM